MIQGSICGESLEVQVSPSSQYSFLPSFFILHSDERKRREKQSISSFATTTSQAVSVVVCGGGHRKSSEESERKSCHTDKHKDIINNTISSSDSSFINNFI
eukprot:TRINITY_DN5291_c0_g1_i1.p1 TRINITY_DN5291_c0_g1~~TRINITY_DN5291_c0_g1_i1.p1  ORF type:complete len:101 (+),score=29.24 TRINITY_DN5291_c0_g1_i1:40-342(+)